MWANMLRAFQAGGATIEQIRDTEHESGRPFNEG
jgi:hypothetical protein